RVATNEQFQHLVTARSWYTPQRVWLAVTVLFTFGVGIAILQYRLAHHSKQTSMRLVVGVCEPDRYVDPPEGTKSARESSLLYLLGAPEGSVIVVHCMLRLTNTGDRAIKGVRVQLESAECYLVDDTVVVLFVSVS